MAFSTLTIQLVQSNYNAVTNLTSNSTVLTLPTSSYPDAVTYVQNLGSWVKDNSGIFYPISGVLSITIS